MHAELLLDVFGQRMHLQAEVLATHGVEEIEADRELCAEAGIDCLPEQGQWFE
ncbi:hypothetical protein D3C81_2313370 [compost metagenome]